jgi:hypothetical protein
VKVIMVVTLNMACGDIARPGWASWLLDVGSLTLQAPVSSIFQLRELFFTRQRLSSASSLTWAESYIMQQISSQFSD